MAALESFTTFARSSQDAASQGAANPGSRAPTDSRSPTADGLGPNTTYTGCDIKLVVHFPSGSDLQSSSEDRVAEIQERIQELRRTIQNVFPFLTDTSGIVGDRPPSELDSFAGLTPAQSAQVTRTYREISALNAELQGIQRPNTSRGQTKTLAEIQTLSVSVFREKMPVRSLGSIYPKSYARGTVTIAGSMIFAMFDKNVWTDVINLFNSTEHPYSDRDQYSFVSSIPHQIPPMDISIVFANELGNVSQMSIYGVELLNEGMTMSIQDIYIENTYTWVARDLSPVRSARDEGIQLDTRGGRTGSQVLRSDASVVEALRRIRENPYR